MLQFILRPQWAVESMGWVLQVLLPTAGGELGDFMCWGQAVWGSRLAAAFEVHPLWDVKGPRAVCSVQGVILARGVLFVEQSTLSAEPFRQICSSELFIASQISSPICLSAYENASLWCTCYISLLLSKIKSQHTLPTSLFICICFWWSASPIRRHTDALDVRIAPCYSFQVPNNEINFVNDKCKGNMQQTEWLHWVAFQADVCWICDADAVFHEQLNFSWLHPPEKDK